MRITSRSCGARRSLSNRSDEENSISHPGYAALLLDAVREALRASGNESPSDGQVANFLLTSEGRQIRNRVAVDFQRAEARRRAPPSRTEVLIAADRAAVSQQAVAPDNTIGNALPFAERINKIANAAPNRMINGRLWESDLEGFKRWPFNKKAFLADLKEVFKLPNFAEIFGHVHPSTVELACTKLAEFSDPDDPVTKGIGMTQFTYKEWAEWARCGRSTIHKIVRGLWELGMVLIQNTSYWVNKDRRNGPNCYFPKVRDSVPMESAPELSAVGVAAETAPREEVPRGAAKAMARIQVALKELLPYFPRLSARVFGFNTSPLRQVSLRVARREAEAPS